MDLEQCPSPLPSQTTGERLQGAGHRAIGVLCTGALPRNALTLPIMAMLREGKNLNALKGGFCEHLQYTLPFQRFLPGAYPPVNY